MTGLLFVQHGLIKLTGFPAGAQPGQQALLSLFGVGGAIELVAGLLILAGLFTRPAAFLLAGQMAVAYFLYHAPRGFFPALNGGIPAILYCFILLYLAAAGAGRWSLDARRTARS
jgi:putative oxidoreductase